MKNKKGFTLLEVLAVIVVLAIILVITVPTVISSISASRNRAFIDTYENLVSDVQAKIIRKIDNKNIEIECADASLNSNYDYVNSKCYDLFDISKDDYKMYILEYNDAYFVILEGIGKFESVDYIKNANELIKKKYYPFNHELNLEILGVGFDSPVENPNYSKNSLMTVISKSGKVLNLLDVLAE